MCAGKVPCNGSSDGGRRCLTYGPRRRRGHLHVGALAVLRSADNGTERYLRSVLRRGGRRQVAVVAPTPAPVAHLASRAVCSAPRPRWTWLPVRLSALPPVPPPSCGRWFLSYTPACWTAPARYGEWTDRGSYLAGPMRGPVKVHHARRTGLGDAAFTTDHRGRISVRCPPCGRVPAQASVLPRHTARFVETTDVVGVLGPSQGRPEAWCA